MQTMGREEERAGRRRIELKEEEQGKHTLTRICASLGLRMKFKTLFMLGPWGFEC